MDDYRTEYYATLNRLRRLQNQYQAVKAELAHEKIKSEHLLGIVQDTYKRKIKQGRR